MANAVKFTPDGGRVEVTLAREADEAVLRVRDTGIGIPQAEQPHLFTRFFRSSLSEEIQASGTGLGLFIVRQVTEAHGGTVKAESVPGQGSTFTVRLPLLTGGGDEAEWGDDTEVTHD